MIQAKIGPGSLLYHATHGLCSVKKLVKQKEAGKDTLFYALEPSTANHMKMRFVIPAEGMEISGFHSLVSMAEANQILKYLKEGSPTDPVKGTDHEAASVAKEILSFSHDQKEVKDQRSRQRMSRLVNGLVGELAVALKITLKETAQLIQKSLGRVSKINPLVLTALENVGEN